MTHYTKQPRTWDEQADLLISRGLDASSKPEIIRALKSVNYYRLSGYTHPFKIPGHPNENFKVGTQWAEIWDRYRFDRQLRVLVMDAIERVEIAIRSQLVYAHVHATDLRTQQKYGPFGYIDPAKLPEIPAHSGGDDTIRSHEQWLKKTREAAENADRKDKYGRSAETFVGAYRNKYTSERDLPLWMVCELMDFGWMVTFWRGSERFIRNKVAREFGVSAEVLNSWITLIHAVRNICAHHGRLWNRVIGTTPMIPKDDRQWHVPVSISPTHVSTAATSGASIAPLAPECRMFVVLSILRYLLGKVASQSQWPTRLDGLFTKFPTIPRSSMGFPANWQQSPIWHVPPALPQPTTPVAPSATATTNQGGV